MHKSTKTPWPTKDAMQQVYELKFWGGKDFDFYSGDGSHNSKIVEPYLKAVSSFLKAHSSTLSVCDLGCGDFNIGKHLTAFTKHYIAIDIVENLIIRNRLLFKENNLEFKCLDIVEDELPKVDCIILKQVLQHLSNSEIQKITKKLHTYKYVILTEHLPSGNYIPNKNIISGQGIRLKQNSGVNILESPFNLKVLDKRELASVILKNNMGQITTTLYQCFK